MTVLNDKRSEPEVFADLLFDSNVEAMTEFKNRFLSNDKKFLLPVCFCLRSKYYLKGNEDHIGKLAADLINLYLDQNLEIENCIVGQFLSLIWLNDVSSVYSIMKRILDLTDKYKQLRILGEAFIDLRFFATVAHTLNIQNEDEKRKTTRSERSEYKAI